MKHTRVALAGSLAFFLLLASDSRAQSPADDIYWHIDPGVETCSMVIDPSLTQAEWHRFTEQATPIVTYKSMAPAEPLGRLKFNISIDAGYTPVNQRDLAWINTFTHPDETCPLGDQIQIPTIRARMGLSEDMDIGVFWTTAPGANYGLVGGEYRYAFLRESGKRPAVAVRASVTVLTGVPDFNFRVHSIDVVTSKRISSLTPYLGLRQSIAVATEKTSKVDLDREIVPATQAFVGAAWSIWKLTLVTEYDISYVNTFTMAVGFNF